MSETAGRMRKVSVNWCPSCHVPTTRRTCITCGSKTVRQAGNGSYRPAYKREIELIGRLANCELMAEPRDYVVWRSGRTYYAGGERFARVRGGGWFESPRIEVLNEKVLRRLQGHIGGRKPKWLTRPETETLDLLRACNAIRLSQLEEEAIVFLVQVRAETPNLPMVVSWSGGKDSTVASVLTQRAFPNEQVTHIFADTTIELPCTHDYLSEFRQTYPCVPFIVSAPARDFLALCEEIGPPSRVQKWCCTTQKAAPLANALRLAGRGKRVIVVSGLRRAESARRSGYDRVMDEGKIGVQRMVNPLLDWVDFDIWAWLATQEIPFNSGYKAGQNRIGCAFCPAAAKWDVMLASSEWPIAYQGWYELLVNIADSAGLAQPEDYVKQGTWRSRLGGSIGKNGLARAPRYEIVNRPCERFEHATRYQLVVSFSLSMLAELLKPFGEVQVETYADVLGEFRVASIHGLLRVTAVPSNRYVRVVFPDARVKTMFEGTIRMQLRKLQACVGCGGCAAICPTGAITEVGENYHIDSARCTHCLKCIRGVKAGCWAAHSLNHTGVTASER